MPYQRAIPVSAEAKETNDYAPTGRWKPGKAGQKRLHFVAGWNAARGQQALCGHSTVEKKPFYYTAPDDFQVCAQCRKQVKQLTNIRKAAMQFTHKDNLTPFIDAEISRRQIEAIYAAEEAKHREELANYLEYEAVSRG